MNKTLPFLAVAGLMMTSTYAQADMAGIEVGAYQWSPDYTGHIAVDDGSTSGSELDLETDLGYADDDHNVIWASLEHPVPFLPNFKIVSSDLDASASSILGREITFGGETYALNESVTSRIDMSNIEYTLYYEFLDNWINLDAGLTFRKYDGIVTLATDPAGTNINESEVLDFTIPLFYLKGRVDLPLTGFFVDGEMNIISYDDNSISDIAFSVGYESDIGLGAKAGYRTFTLDVEESDFVSDLEFKGAYVSVFFHF
ncbi:MAG: TIGR04219 family outer membrane beta-barrel protein [Kangiellaceae bacterium]|nr:TIGR04219 family outer membrane beta-barrel protein [Kangiellaceae bacterium]